MSIRVIPCLLLRQRGLVKTIKFKQSQYVGCPINALKIFNEKEVDEIVFLDIGASIEKRKPDYNFIADIASEAFMPFAYGGGIKELDDVQRIFGLGVEKVVINSHAIENPMFIKKAAELFGRQSIVVSIDVKRNILGKYEVFTFGGKKNCKLDPVEYAKKMGDLGAGEIFLNSMDRDGTGLGYDLKIIKEVSKAISVPLIVCGGAGKLDHFKEAVDSGASGVAAGSFFVFHGTHRAVLITYPERKEIDNLFDGIK